MQLKNVTLETFSHSLAELKLQHALSHAEIARIAGVSRAAVYKWLAGKTPPGSIELLRLSRHFHVSMDTLLTGRVLAANTREMAAPPSRRISPETLREAIEAAQKIVALQDELKKMS